MKCLSLVCLLLLASCGSPLDQGYWKEHNQEADPNQDNNDSKTFSIQFDSLHTNIENLSFSGETLTRTGDQLKLSVEVTRPNQIILEGFRLSAQQCGTPTTNVSVIDNGSSTSTFDAQIAWTTSNGNPENFFIYLTGRQGQGLAVIDLACSAINL